MRSSLPGGHPQTLEVPAEQYHNTKQRHKYTLLTRSNSPFCCGKRSSPATLLSICEWKMRQSTWNNAVFIAIFRRLTELQNATHLSYSVNQLEYEGWNTVFTVQAEMEEQHTYYSCAYSSLSNFITSINERDNPFYIWQAQKRWFNFTFNFLSDNQMTSDTYRQSHWEEEQTAIMRWGAHNHN